MSLCCQRVLDVLDPARITQPGPGAHHAAQPCLAEEPAPAPLPAGPLTDTPFSFLKGSDSAGKQSRRIWL